MKSKFLYICMSLTLLSCQKLDLNPLSQGSGETWNGTAEELIMSLNDLYRSDLWIKDLDDWTDDWMFRDGLTEITNATLNGQTGFVNTGWKNTYKNIARANTVLQNMERVAGVLPEAQVASYTAEARFVRASMYSYLLSHYRNVVYVDRILTIEEAEALDQIPPQELLTKIYEDYDFAIANLKDSYSSNELKRATKGAALALKARIALYMGDYATAKTAAQACIDLGIYTLHPDYGDLFLSKTKQSPESIFLLPRSISLGVVLGDRQNYIPRNNGGWAAKNPSWDLLYAYYCNDGLPVDESDRFDPTNPFANRDPRCVKTIVPFDEPHLDFVFTPHPLALKTTKISTGQQVANNDNRAVAQYASFNGLLWNKGVDNDWLLNSWRIEPDNIIIRYADILLIYAEAKIELNEIDESVLHAINQVRARAYKVDVASPDYPKVNETAQEPLRKILRAERRMEFALEGLRYMDIIRWKTAEKALNTPNYGLLDPADLIAKVVNTGKWFLPEAPPVDEDGLPDFSAFFSQGLIKQIAIRKFDASKQYIWPIPSTEVLTSGLKQNPNY
ncbi:RagB/SusD family nutrient uptake outer membrane protein [Sphingobacterium sp. JB170]|uniref:RagB/SusD family nutrient uptake outer membrane protein n=1 Tax=Sphingobacterium sp. JB170 TaxID=1434842 RepID=UPI00097ED705|nr:RagB/SusD family nutrient uptake outer membrane protein [Sphingobacterium sp. JB170]SJN19818.1 Putative outer membrane protein, probably involved in nutrient binding [Sphingobacterium sp. JB170]